MWASLGLVKVASATESLGHYEMKQY